MGEGGSRNGASLSLKRLNAEGLKGGLLHWGALGMGISLHRGSVGRPGVGLSTGDFERWVILALEVGCLSLWVLCERKLEGGLPGG
jgi:hypothetical protein